MLCQRDPRSSKWRPGQRWPQNAAREKKVAQGRLEKHGEIYEHERTQENGWHEAQKFAEKEELNALDGGFTVRRSVVVQPAGPS